jgi:hypothetical protein
LKPAVGSARKGTKEIVVPEEYFNDEFMARLREEKEVVTPSFTVRHEGFEDATLISGEVYTNCDKILIYDVKSNKDSFLYNLIESLIDINDVAEGEVRSDLEDAELRAHITSEIDAFGAAKIDLKGKSNGINIIAGFDFLHH